MPRGTLIATAMKIAADASFTEGQKRSATSYMAGCLVRIELPKSPRTARERKTQYW